MSAKTLTATLVYADGAERRVTVRTTATTEAGRSKALERTLRTEGATPRDLCAIPVERVEWRQWDPVAGHYTTCLF